MWLRRRYQIPACRVAREPRQGPLPKQEGGQGRHLRVALLDPREDLGAALKPAGGFVLGLHFASRGLQTGPGSRG